jgi:RNA polymerase sigma-54 factor
MNLGFRQTLQLKQTLSLNQVMIQRFNVLQQSAEEFEQMVENESQKNQFIQFQRFGDQPSIVGDSAEGGLSAIDFATYDESLMSVLTNQLDRQMLPERDYEIVLMLIDDCNDLGFITDYKAVRSKIMQEYLVSEREVFRCLKILQSFEPDGVGARSLNECLWIQIDNYDLDDATDTNRLKQLVKDFLDDISVKNYDPILKKMGISQDQLDYYLTFISHLNPNPAAQYSNKNQVVIQPSLRIEEDQGILTLVNLEEERITVSLNESMLKQLEENPTEKLKKELNQAKIWVEHFKKRQQLLRFCGDYLMNHQRLYFLEGDDFIIPCLQKDLARSLEVAESTISRLVRSKYIQSKHGVILIQLLCQRNIYGKTTQQVKGLIRYYCEKYPHFSDLKISELLKSIGLPIARRTVAKYRKNSQLLSSYRRRRGSH